MLLLWTSQGFQLWETATGNLRGKVEWGEFARMGPMEFSPDGTRLAHVDYDGRVTLWDTADAKEVFFRKLPGQVNSLAFTRGHRYLATGNGNGTIFIFRLP